MRALVLAVAIAGCAPDIATGTYFCGIEQACPPDQACNGPDNTCVTKGSEVAFSCTNSGATIPTLGCITAPIVLPDCFAAGARSNMYSFTTPSGCASLEVDLSVVYPLAFEQVDVQLWQGATMVATSSTCSATTAAGGSESRCLVASGVATGSAYTAVVVPAGRDCNGACNFNRYELTIELSSVH
jgi:hypothetical protein